MFAFGPVVSPLLSRNHQQPVKASVWMDQHLNRNSQQLIVSFYKTRIYNTEM